MAEQNFFDFQDIIDKLLTKKAEVKVKREELDAADARIDRLLLEAGYVEPVAETVEVTGEEISVGVEVEAAEEVAEEAVNESIYEPTSSWKFP